MGLKTGIVLGVISMFLGGMAYGEDGILYSYTRTGVSEYAIMPVNGEVGDGSAASLFEALKRRKLPTYGSTRYEASRNRVVIDDTKCGYGSVILAEVGETFRAHGERVPQGECGGQVLPDPTGRLTHFVAVVPLWRALSMKGINEPALVDVGGTYMGVEAYRAAVARRDKALMQAVEAGLNDPNGFVRAGMMQGMLFQKFPNAEKRVARELGSREESSVRGAMEALLGARDKGIVSQLLSALKAPGEVGLSRAQIAIRAVDSGVREAAVLILLGSSDDVWFERARAVALESGVPFWAHFAELVSSATPAHARVLTEMMMSSGHASALASWLDDSDGGENAQAVADAACRSEDAVLRRAAFGVRLVSPDSVVAFEALDGLRREPGGLASYGVRGMASPHDWIAAESAAAVEDAGVCTVLPKRALLPGVAERFGVVWRAQACESVRPGAAGLKSDVWPKVRTNPDELVSVLTPLALDANAAVRRDVAYATRWIGESGDSLRSVLLKDSDDLVVTALVAQLVRHPSVSLPLVKEVIARAERSPRVAVLALYALPRVMQEKTAQSVTAFAGNEMFDGDMSVRIAAIRALSEIGSVSRDPVVVDNAVTSLALTAQDASPEIATHTLMGLARIRVASAQDIVERAKDAQPEVYARVRALYP